MTNSPTAPPPPPRPTPPRPKGAPRPRQPATLARWWGQFRALPTWVQVVLWLVGWPLLGAFALISGPRPGRWQIATAIVLLVVGTPVWAAALGNFGSDEPAPPVEIAADTSEPDGPGPEAPEPVADEDPEPKLDVATALETELASICQEALGAADRIAARVAVRRAASELAADSEFRSTQIRSAVDEACGDELGDLPEPEPEPKPEPKREQKPEPAPRRDPAPAPWTVIRIIDGDTVEVRNSSGTENVRVIGIDTPERGDCGFEEASDALATLVLDKPVVLVDGARDDRDRYDRILRYLDVAKLDAGLSLIEQGLAIARYDSRDGYGRHPRQDAYVAADAATPHRCHRPPPDPEPKPKAPPQPAQPASGPGSGPGGAWKNCTEAREAGAAPVHRGEPGYGGHLDRDDDGIGCE